MAGFQKGMHAAERDRAIAESLTRIRDIESRKGISRDTLEDIKGVLTEWSVKKELISEEKLPSPQSGDRLYCLSEDDDHRFALYLSTGAPGNATPPHNHTTWAVIVGLAGEKENRIYQRTDGGLRQVDTVVLKEGMGCGYLPDYFHSIHVKGKTPTRHFHLYGLAIDHQTDRLRCDVDKGAFSVYSAPPNILK